MNIVDLNIFKEVKPRPSVTLCRVRFAHQKHDDNETFSLYLDKLEISAGTIHCIYGTNGSGKTSLLKALSGIIPNTEGAVIWKNLEKPVPGKDFIFVSQAGPWPHLSVWQNIVEPQIESGITKIEAEGRSQKIINLLGLNKLETRYAHQLSAGQQQRTELARSLALSPKILFLDEIMSGQSEFWSERIAMILKQFANLGGMVLMVSHDPEWVTLNADRVTHIVSGHNDAVSSTRFFCGYDGDSEGWVNFREQRLREAMK